MGGALAAAALYLFLPWTAEINLQTLMSRGRVDGTKITGTLETVAKSVFPIRGRRSFAPNEVNLPIVLHGIAPDDRLIVDALYIQMTARSGREWSAGLIPVIVRPAIAGQALINAEIAVDRDLFAEESSRPISLRAKLYLTVFGKPRSATIPIRRQPVTVMDGLRCSEGTLIEFVCRSTFRWPQRLVSIDYGETADSMSTLSYSPFAAGLGSEPIEAYPFSLPSTATDVTISSRAPIAHIRTEIAIPDVILARFTMRAKLAEDRGVGINALQ
jgi:hypothetical protein